MGFAFLGLYALGSFWTGIGFDAWVWGAVYALGAFVGSGWWRGLKGGLGVLGLHGGVVLVASWLGSGIVDVGWDSVQTHQVGVVGVQSGWNPLNPEDREWLEELPADGLVRSDPELTQAWLHFNLLYVAAALFGSLPFGFEGGKGVQLVWALTLFLNVLSLLRLGGISRGWRYLVGIGLTLNPVIGYQMWTLYQDLGVAVFSTLAILGIWALTRGVTAGGLVRFGLAVLLLVLVKRSGVVVGGPLLVLAAGILAWRFEGRVRLGLGVAALTGVVALGGIAIGSGALRGYDRELVFDMVFKPAAFDRERGMKVPEHLENLGRPELFGRSLLESTHVERGAEMKVPLTWSREEWRMFRVVMYPGYTSGGFGPLFSGGLLLAAMALCGWGTGREAKVGRGGRAGLVIVLIGLCLILPSSFGRWVPFVWTLPWLAILGMVLSRETETDPVLRGSITWRGGSLLRVVVGTVAAAVLVLNGVLVAVIHHDAQREATGVVEAFFADIAERAPGAVPVALGRSIAVKRWFWERGQGFTAVEGIEPPFREVPFTWARIPRHLEVLE